MSLPLRYHLVFVYLEPLIMLGSSLFFFYDPVHCTAILYKDFHSVLSLPHSHTTYLGLSYFFNMTLLMAAVQWTVLRQSAVSLTRTFIVVLALGDIIHVVNTARFAIAPTVLVPSLESLQSLAGTVVGFLSQWRQWGFGMQCNMGITAALFVARVLYLISSGHRSTAAKQKRG